MKLIKLPYSEDYIQNRVDRFYEEFLSSEQSYQHLEQILLTVHNYMVECDDGESVELHQSIIQLRQSIFWVQSWSNLDSDPID